MTGSSPSPHLWVRHEARSTERRAPVVPDDVRRLGVSRPTYEPQSHNYVDEVIYFTDKPSLVNSFKTRFDDAWTDTVKFTDYVPQSATRALYLTIGD